jgi:hypothetical protein
VDILRATAKDFAANDADVVDAAKQQSGIRLADLSGTGAIREPGVVGDQYADRLANVHPRMTGPAMIARILGFGEPDADGSEVILGRIAKGALDHAGIGFYEKTGGTESTWASTTGTMLTLTTNVALTIPGGVQSLLVALGWCEVKAQSTGISITPQLRITANNTTGNPGIENFGGTLGRENANVGGDTNWHTAMMFHAVRLAPATDLLLDNRLIRLKTITAPALNNLIRDAWVAVLRLPW